MKLALLSSPKISDFFYCFCILSSHSSFSFSLHIFPRPSLQFLFCKSLATSSFLREFSYILSTSVLLLLLLSSSHIIIAFLTILFTPKRVYFPFPEIFIEKSSWFSAFINLFRMLSLLLGKWEGETERDASNGRDTKRNRRKSNGNSLNERVVVFQLVVNRKERGSETLLWFRLFLYYPCTFTNVPSIFIPIHSTFSSIN